MRAQAGGVRHRGKAEDSGKDAAATEQDSGRDAAATEQDSGRDAAATEQDSGRDAAATRMTRGSPTITPLPAPIARLKRGTVIVMGGTFDPPHRWHVRGAVLARRRASAGAWLLFVPASRNPLKATGPVASDAERIAMLGLALKGVAKSAVWTDEVDRAATLALRGATQPSYTIDTLRRLRRLLPAGVTLRLLIGGDQAAEFHKWKSARAVVRLAEPLVMPRGAIVSGVDLRAGLREGGFWREAEVARWGERLVSVPVAGVASTAVRAGGEDGMLAASVRRFIRSHGLYGR